MNTNRKQRRHPNCPALLRLFVLAMFSLAATTVAQATSLTVTGVNGNGTTTPVPQYRWTLEEDNTYHVIPGNGSGENGRDPETLSVRFHQSYMQVVAAGDETTPLPALDSAKYYYVSVIPKAAGAWAIGGAPFKGSDASVNVLMNALPLPTAQIKVFVYEDNQPINSAPDLPVEVGLAGFSLILEDAGGRYGISAGVEMMDAFGNPLGTSYRPVATGKCKKPEVQQGDQCVTMGTGVILTDAEGITTIKNLSPGKYGIIAVPPAGKGWVQTSTIEGTHIIDAWVAANEPPYFQEFGAPGPHVSIGFVNVNPRPANAGTGDPGNLVNSPAALNGTATLTGTIVNLHMSRPPDYNFFNGAPLDHTTAWVGLNRGAGGVGPAIYARPVRPDGSFTINNVPAGDYQFVVWDDALDVIFAFKGVTVNADGTCTSAVGTSCSLGDIPVFQWFTRQHHYVFADTNGNGYRDPGEEGIPDQNINIRWRDGTINQAAPTDGEGFVPFDETFPFFAWQVAEVDYLRFKPTGVTVTVDNGGDIPFTNPLSWDGLLNPQPQCVPGVAYDPVTLKCPAGSEANNPITSNNLQRTEIGPALLEAFQGFIGQGTVFEWGKQPYAPGENGGIAGIVYYDSTRAENNPRYNFAEPFEPGIPRVQVNLYRDANNDGIIDNINLPAGIQLADVDNPPLGWSDGLAKGLEDIDYDGNSTFDLGDALEAAHTDSWDDNPPTGCQGEQFVYMTSNGQLSPKDCYDGLRNFNQVRPGVFDGGYAFGFLTGNPLPAGVYIVQTVPPPGYEIVKEQDKNVDFGEEYVPSKLALPAQCVGGLQDVPAELDLFPGTPVADTLQDAEPATPGVQRPTCDFKQVYLSDGQNAAADFFLLTKAPIAGHIYGFILDDTANEFDPNAPNFGEKYAPPHLPISVRDWTGQEIARTYSDAYGVYNALVPSTYTANQPKPSGWAPNMITVCLNSPFKPNPAYVPGGSQPQFIQDEFFNRQYTQFCYTLQYMPGATTYLDTPVIPVAAMAGPGGFALDCQPPNGTPVIDNVTNTSNQGPYVLAGQTLAITSVGTVEVPNPAWSATTTPEPPKTINRDFGFGGTKGRVWIGATEVPALNIAWGAQTVTITVPAGAATGQLVVQRGDSLKFTIAGVTVTVGGPAPITVAKAGVASYRTIQEAIDFAKDGDLITVAPGVYEELVIMWKPVRLQGWGPGSVRINAVKSPAYKLQYWRDKISNIVLSGAVDLLPGQEVGAGALEPALLFNEEGSGILVLGKRNAYKLDKGLPNARIDGFEVTGADHAGGVVLNGYAHFLQISNNVLTNNTGTFGGGIRAGHPTLTVDNVNYQSSFNDSLTIHHNMIVNNGGLDGAGGGVALYKGCDGYRLSDNYVCGNFSLGEGGGIGHMGLSPLGRIERNWVLFNETFNQGVTVSGGGIFVGGSAPLAVNGLTEGSGSVAIVGNWIQGNLAGAGDGGGIRTSRVNGQDVTAPRATFATWYGIDILNNVIVNNVAGLAGGGISLQDTAKVNIIHNTVARNDSTATAGEAFIGPNTSAPKPAGIVARVHTPGLAAAIPATYPQYRVFSNPQLVNTIVYENRSFYFDVNTTVDPPDYRLFPAATPYDDLAVLGAAAGSKLSPKNNLLTTLTGVRGESYTGNGNITTNPLFVQQYFNGSRTGSIVTPELTTPQAPPAFDEGGNFIKIRFQPLTLYRVTDQGVLLTTAPCTGTPCLFGDYHIQSGSPARNFGTTGFTGTFPDLTRDFDGENRPQGTAPDIGADETPSAVVRRLTASATTSKEQ